MMNLLFHWVQPAAALMRAVLLLFILGAWPIHQANAADSHLADFLDKAPLEQILPAADHLGAVEGSPPAAPAFKGDQLVGYVFLNSDVVNSTGYSGRPINVVIGIDTAGTITGAKLVEHHEPIVLIGIPEPRIRAYIDGFIGSNPAAGTFPDGKHSPDIISGATVTVLVLSDTITKSTIRIARSRRLGAGAASSEQVIAQPARALDMARTGHEDWEQLLGDGSVRRLHLSVADVNKDFAASADTRAADRPEPGPDDDTFIDLYVALVSAPVIGRSLLGDSGYEYLSQHLASGQQAIAVIGTGRYSFRGSGYVRGGIFDRIQLVQEQNTVRFHDHDYQRLANIAADGAPSFPEIGLFTLPQGSEFDPAAAWRLTLLIQRAVGPLDKVFLTSDLPYQLPEKHLTPPPPAVSSPTSAFGQDASGETPLWVSIWQQRKLNIALLSCSLIILTLIFFFQDWLVRHPRLIYWTRTCFLLFTLFWIGWYGNAQLSVVNILALTNALVSGFRWDYFLMDPLVFILWSATAASLLFWGRGAFCGWLCPFGALQEFVNRIAKRLRIPQIVVPWAVHERLWAIKYIIFLALFGLSLYSLANAERLAEIEPFKTAIILKFIRAWPFALFAGVLVAASLFIERFFCRYLCPLGAALAIPARIRMFDWLKRYKECGTPCQRCAIECPVQSIHPDGRINPNECIYCMHCQELYWDDHRCPVVIQRRIKRERLQTMSAAPLPAPKPSLTPIETGGDNHVG